MGCDGSRSQRVVALMTLAAFVRARSDRRSFVRRTRRLRLIALLGICVVTLSSEAIVAQQQRVVARGKPATPSNLADSVVVTNAWARPALKDGTGGAYFTITNNSLNAIRVVSASCACASSTELHVSSVQNGMAHMEMLPRLVITPGASASLKPGGMHFMLVGLRKAFVKGDSARLSLRLDDGAQVGVTLRIRAQ